MTKSKSVDKQSNISNQNDPNSKPKNESGKCMNEHPLINLSKNYPEISQPSKELLSKKNFLENKFYISQEINKGP
jgi:hypothetical protein